MDYEFILNVSAEKGIELIAEQLIELIDREIVNSGTVNILMSGGNTPKRLYEELLLHHNENIAWKSCRFIILDERYVSFSDGRSNSGECYRHFISKIEVKDFIYPDTSKPIEECVNLYSKSIKSYAGRVHLAILGTANDGHLASIFPQMKVLAKSEHCFACSAENISEARVSLTLDFINQSKNLWMMAFGKNKSRIIEMARALKVSDLPALKLNIERRPKWFICDE